MDKLTVTLKTVTPMFLGGADPNNTAELRAPSIKGVLRFWWRALNWGRFRSKVLDDAEALRDMHKEESLLFGSAADGKGGQGCFLLKVTHGALSTTSKNAIHRELAKKDAARYLGYGVIVPAGSRTQQPPTQSGQLIRSCINEDQSFTIILLFKNKIDDSIVQAIKAMGLLGGLGSRTRRGMGSISLESLMLTLGNNEKEIWRKSTNLKEYAEQVNALFVSPYGIADIPEPPFSAFCKKARIDCLVTGKTAYDVLDQLGHAMLMYRSWGRTTHGNKISGGGVSEINFKDDHDWSKDLLTTTRPDFHPERVMFGLPHDYGRQDKQKVKAEKHDRRSSPILLHVHRFSDNDFIGVSIYLPSQFLPVNEKIKAGGNDVPFIPDYSVLTDFIDGKDRKSPNVVTNRFPNKQVIL